MRFRKLTPVAAIGVLGLIAGCGGDNNNTGAVDQVTLSVSHGMAEADSSGIQEWMRLVQEETQDAVDFEIFYNESLCPITETPGCVQDGRADIGFSSSIYVPADFPITEIGAVGFQTVDLQAQIDSLQTLYDETPEMQDEFSALNQRLLYFHAPGIHQIVLSQRVESLDDLAGLSIRSVGGQAANLAALGANPIDTNPFEVYEAIERGVLDGASYPLELIGQNRIAEVAPYIHDTGAHHGSIAMMHWTINLDTWEGLDPAIQTAIDEASRTVSATFVDDHLYTNYARACETLAEDNGEIVPIGTPEEGEAWRESALPPREEQWISGVEGVLEDPEGFYSRYQELLAENTSGEALTGGQFCQQMG